MWWKLARPQVLCRWYQCIERPSEPTPSSNANEIAPPLQYDSIAPAVHYCSINPTKTFHTYISSRMMVWQSLQKQAIITPPAILADPLSIQNITIIGSRKSSRNSIYCPEQEWDKSFCKFQLTPLILQSELRREKEASMKFQQSHKSAMLAFHLNLR